MSVEVKLEGQSVAFWKDGKIIAYATLNEVPCTIRVALKCPASAVGVYDGASRAFKYAKLGPENHIIDVKFDLDVSSGPPAPPPNVQTKKGA